MKYTEIQPWAAKAWSHQSSTTRLLYATDFQAKACTGLGDKCLVICIGAVETGSLPGVTISLADDVYTIVISVVQIASRWLAAADNNYCIIAVGQGVAQMRLVPEWIAACAIDACKEAKSAAHALYALQKPNWFKRLRGKAEMLTPRALAFFRSYRYAILAPDQFHVPEIFLSSITMKNLTRIDPIRGNRIMVMVTNEGQIIHSTLQHSRLKWQTSTQVTMDINCKFTGCVTLRGYHIPERMSINDPRRALFELDIHSGIANSSGLCLEFPSSCIEQVSDVFPSSFAISMQFSREADEMRSDCRPICSPDDRSHDDYLFAINLQRQLDQESGDPDNLPLDRFGGISRMTISDDAISAVTSVVELPFFSAPDDDNTAPFRMILSQNDLIAHQVVESVQAQAATASQINRLPEFSLLLGSPLQGNPCLICKSPFAIDDLLRTLPCLHMMHSFCITEWLQRKACCPVCMTAV